MKKLVLLSALVAVGSASASMFGDVCPVIGADFKWTKMKNSSDWDNEFAESFPGGTIYLGAKFSENFGAELGYSTTSKKSKDITLATGQNIGGISTPAANNGQTLTTKVRTNGAHLDLVGYLPIDNGFELFGALGLGFMNASIDIATNSAITGNFLTALTSMTGSHKVIPRIGIGANWMATEMVGLRAKLGWEGTNRLRIKDNKNYAGQTFSDKPFKSSYSLALGAFVKF